MFPVLPILFIAMRAGGGGRPRSSTSSERLLAVLYWSIGLPIAIAMLVGFWEGGPLVVKLGVLAAAAALPFISFPSAITRFVLVPLGAYKAAARLAMWSLWVWGGDREGGAVVAGAAALARNGKLDADARKAAFAWLDARVQRVKNAHGAVLLGQSVLARMRGDHARADRLLHAIAYLPDEMTPSPARSIATEVVVGDALIAGDYVRARGLTRASGARAGGSTRAKLLVACAEALAPPLKARGAVARWWARLEIHSLALRARPRHAWRRLVDDALAALTPEGGRASPDAVNGSSTSASTGAALDDGGLTKAQAAVLWSALARRAGAALSESDRARVSGAVDDAAFSLNHEIPDDLGLVESATDALAEVLKSVASSWTAAQRQALGSSTLARAENQSRGALDELHAICDDLPRPEPLPAAAEIEDWARIRLLYDRAIEEAGDELAMAPYEAVRDALWNHSARIFNKGQKGVGRAIFQFLLAEALKRGDEPAIKGMRKNLRAQ